MTKTMWSGVSMLEKQVNLLSIGKARNLLKMIHLRMVPRKSEEGHSKRPTALTTRSTHLMTKMIYRMEMHSTKFWIWALLLNKKIPMTKQMNSRPWLLSKMRTSKIRKSKMGKHSVGKRKHPKMSLTWCRSIPKTCTKLPVWKSRSTVLPNWLINRKSSLVRCSSRSHSSLSRMRVLTRTMPKIRCVIPVMTARWIRTTIISTLWTSPS